MRPDRRDDAGTVDNLQPIQPIVMASGTGTSSSNTQLITPSRQRQLLFVLQNGFFKTKQRYSSDNCPFLFIRQLTPAWAFA
jgi:hypothetical protein